MFQLEIDNKYKEYDTKTVKVVKREKEMVVSYNNKELFCLDIPEDLKKSFDLIPEKRGYIKKDEYGKVFFTLIRYLDYHIHSEYSLLDGANKISNIVKKSEGCTGITDHGSMFGVLNFFKKMDEALKKPIIGIEVYTETIDGNKEACHMVLLVKNETGWKNICKIVSEAETNFYKKPQVSYDMLERYHEGLICTTACLGGEVAETIAQKSFDKASEVVEVLQGIFGEDFYIEIQNHNIGAMEEMVNNALWAIAEINDIKVVGAMDSHYTEKEDEYAHEILLCIGTKKKISDPDRYKFEGDNYYLKNADEFEETFSETPELISNTLEIVDKCEFRFELGKKNMPNFKIPEGYKDEIEYFEHQCKEGYEYRFGNGDIRHDDTVYLERFKYEIEQIEKTGFYGYFLIVQDYVIWAKEHGIYVGPGRGSCVGSLVCYCLRITELDPIPYGLLFERFINPERISPPD